MTTGQRMKMRRKEIGLSAERVAEILGISPATIYRYERGDIEKVPGDLLQPIANALQTTPAYLMGWDSSASLSSSNIIPTPHTYTVPLVGTIACGQPILAVENADEMVEVPEHIRADFALRCKGDSMIDARIYDGDIVYIHSQPEVENGEIAAVRIGEEATLKKVRSYPDMIILEPANHAFEPLVYRGEELNEIEVLGKAVAFTSMIR